MPDLDLTAEFITYRFTPKSKSVRESWYPGSNLDMEEEPRSRKLTKFGSVKYVYPATIMRQMKEGLLVMLRERLPSVRVLYWT